MGSTIQTCCGDGSHQNKKQPKKTFGLSTSCTLDRHPKDERIKDGPIIFTQQDIIKLLGSLVVVCKETQFDDFQLQGVLGLGAFGIVYLGELKKNKQLGKVQKYAIKRIPKQLLLQKNMITNAIDQRDILAMCNRFLVSLIMAFQDPWYLYLVMEYAKGGDTYDLIKPGSFKLNTFKNLGEDGVRFIGASVILALEFLHANNYVYRDIKPQNILLFENGYVKVTDFGLVKKCVEGKKNQTISGTQLYYAPQMVLTKGYDKQVDFWGFGVYLYQLSNYETPFEEDQITKTRFEAACKGAEKNRIWHNPNLSPELKDLINKLLKFDASQRIGVKGGWKQVKEHPFFKDFPWQELTNGKLQSPLQKIVSMFPPSVKPFKPQPRETESQQVTTVEGWSLVKTKTI